MSSPKNSNTLHQLDSASEKTLVVEGMASGRSKRCQETKRNRQTNKHLENSLKAALGLNEPGNEKKSSPKPRPKMVSQEGKWEVRVSKCISKGNTQIEPVADILYF